LSIKENNENNNPKNYQFDYTSFYREATENYYKFLADSWKIIINGIMYWNNSDLANQMRETYENNYKQLLKNYEDWNERYRF
jgi:hypothetical protein